MRAIMETGLRPLVMRLYDAEDTAFSGLAADGCLLIVAQAGPRAVATAESELVAGLCAAARALGEGPWQGWLAHRFDLSAERLRRNLEPPAAVLDTIEVGAGWRALPELHGEVKAALAELGVVLCHFSHASGQGCCAYFTVAGAAADEEAAQEAYRRAWSAVMEAALRGGATISHHHGVGQARAAWIRRELGGWWDVWRAVRDGLDPGRSGNPHALGGLEPPP
jgi:alkyldihydroxyacetonephosphate synthase